MNKNKIILVPLLVMAFVVGTFGQALASSHREAPLISQDSVADTTDVYAFVSPDKQDTVTLIANYLPFEEPAGGPNFYRFGDDVLYTIRVDNDGDAKEDVAFEFRFKTKIVNGNTFLATTGPVTSLNDENLNIRQTYTLTKVRFNNNGRVIDRDVLGRDIPVAPSNVGPKSMPDYNALAAEAIKNVRQNVTTFAGQRDDPFFVELGGVFDLLSIRKLPGNAGGGVDGLAGYNVQSLALQVPMTLLTRDYKLPANKDAKNAIIGVWSTSYRKASSVLAKDADRYDDGDDKWVQVSRLGSPLVNEVVVPLKDKDKWNSSRPQHDRQFLKYVTNPELGGLLNGLFGIAVPPQGEPGSGNERNDLVAVFLTGIPGLTKPAGVIPSEQLRLNLAIKPSETPNSLGVVGGDLAGFPNGRRLADDVTDIELKAVAGAAYPIFHPEFTPDPLAAKLGDGVDKNDKEFSASFPYLASPMNGFDSRPHISDKVLAALLALPSDVKTAVQHIIDMLQ